MFTSYFWTLRTRHGDGWTLRDGSHITLRPMLAQDAPLLDDMLERLSPSARHQRFHGGVNSQPALLTPAQGPGLVTFVLQAERRGRVALVAEARYAVDSDGEGAEFALVVDDHWRRKGLGQHAMRALCNTAAQAGLHWLHGEVRADNRAMLALMQRSHFCCTPDQEDARLVHAECALRAEALRA